MDLAQLTDEDLYAWLGAVLGELRGRGFSGNGLCADLAERLVRTWLDGDMAPPSTKGWDVRAADGQRLQVKSRVVSNQRDAGQRQLSFIRSWDFDQLAIVLFNPDFTVWRAVSLPRDRVEQGARRSQHVNGWRVRATNALLAGGRDLRPYGATEQR